MTSNQSQIDSLDLAYQKLSGFKFKVRGVVTGREQAWHAFITAGFGLPDLERTIRWIKHRIREGKRDIGALRFSSLIGNLDRFDEEQSMAAAESRNARPNQTPKERAIECLRPTASEAISIASDAKPISHWIEKLREAAQ